MEVRAAIRGERDELPVELDALRQAAAELGQQVCHLPAPAAASSEAGVCADHATEPIYLRLEHPAASVRDRPGSGQHGLGQPQYHLTEPISGESTLAMPCHDRRLVWELKSGLRGSS